MKKIVSVGIALVVGLFVVGSVQANSLEVVAEAAMEGSFGLKVNVTDGDNTATYVQSDHPVTESHYNASFKLNPGTMVMGANAGENNFIFFAMYRDVGPNIAHTLVYMVRNKTGDAYQLSIMTRKDFGSWQWVGGFFIGAVGSAPDRDIVIDWTQSDGSNNGAVQVYRDGVLMCEATGLNNDEYNVDFVRAGIPPYPDIRAGTSGYFYFDDFVSTR